MTLERLLSDHDLPPYPLAHLMTLRLRCLGLKAPQAQEQNLLQQLMPPVLPLPCFVRYALLANGAVIPYTFQHLGRTSGVHCKHSHEETKGGSTAGVTYVPYQGCEYDQPRTTSVLCKQTWP